MTSERSALRDWLTAVVVATPCAALLFVYVGHRSSYLTIDSGPYLSMAHHLAAEGRLVSGFNFLGNFESIPSAPNYAPPGLALLLAAAAGLATDALAAGRGVLLVALVLLQVLVIRILGSATGSPAYAAGASIVIVSHPDILIWSAAILTEIPFLAALAGSVLAALAVLERPGTLRALALGGATAALCLTRTIGLFLPGVVSLALLAGGTSHPPARRARALAVVHAVWLPPLAAWLLAVGASSPSLLPRRPPAQLDLLPALLDAAGFLLRWLGPWAGLAVILWALLPAAPGRPGRGTVFLAGSLAAYLAVLLVVRTRSAYYPLHELGARYMAPACLLALLLGAVVIHGMAWRGRPPGVRASVCILAALVAGWSAWSQRSFRLPAPFPVGTETLRTFVEEAPAGAVALANYGQALVIQRPDLRVVGIPSLDDFVYGDEPVDVIREHDVRWIVLFRGGARESRYPAWFAAWLHEPPETLAVQRTWRLADGVIYHLS